MILKLLLLKLLLAVVAGGGDAGAAMNRFRYGRDPLFLICCGLYAVNRWVLKPNARSPFLHGHFNDLLLIPCALPPMLWVQRKLGLRGTDASPTAGEILFHVAVWSVLCEAIGPRLMRVTGDPFDVLAYAIGGVLGGVILECPQPRLSGQ